MASTYSSKLRLELITTSEKSGSWGTITNTNLGTLLEQAIAGVAAVNFGSDANYTLTTQNGSSDEARCAVLSCTSSGSLTATRDLIVPTSTKVYLVYNNTTGGQSIRVKTTAGTGITIANGKKAMVYCDGTNVVDAITSLPSGTTIGGASLSSYALAGANTDITSIYLNNTGLKIKDTNASHGLSIVPGSDLTADRTFTLTTGDAARTLDISAGSVTISAAGAALIDDADVAAQRTTLGLGTAALAATGTSGGTVPLLNTAVTFSDSLSVNKGAGGDSQIVLGGANNTATSFYMSSNAGQYRYCFVRTGTSVRFAYGVTNTAESGANAGSNFSIDSYTDAGSYLATPLLITRSTGVVSFSARPTFNGNTALDTVNGAALSGATFTGNVLISKATPIFTLTDTGGGGASIASYSLSGAAYRQYNADTVESIDTTTFNILLRDLRITAAPTSLATTSAGFRGLGTPNVQTAAYQFVLADSGQVVKHNSGSSHAFTIPPVATVAFPNGTLLPVSNIGAGTMVLTPGAGVTLYNDAGTSGSITLNQHQGGTLERDSDTGTNTWRYRGSHA